MKFPTEERYITEEQAVFNLEAEQSVLGSILIDPTVISTVFEYLKPESFYKEQHVALFSIMLRMFTAGQPTDVVTVLNEAIKDNVFATPADAKMYLTQLVQLVPTTANVESYAKIVQDYYYTRSLLQAANNIIDYSKDHQADSNELLDMAEQQIFDIRQGKGSTGFAKIDQVILQVYDRLQRLTGEDKDNYLGIPTGFSVLDNVITGLNKSDLILIAARPGMGKTAFALNIASNVALKQNKAVAIFSLEMSSEQLVSRILSAEAFVEGTSLRTGNLSSDDWIKLATASQAISKAPIYIDDTPQISVSQMKAKLRRMKDVGLVIIDYLQLMRSDRRIDNRVQEVSELTRSLKIMAKELDVPVITLSQLSRGPESRTDKKPQLSDLRESGSIEQDADIVMLLYRESYYDRDSENRNIAECLVAKNRHGAIDTVRLGWDSQYTRFSNLELFRDEG